MKLFLLFIFVWPLSLAWAEEPLSLEEFLRQVRSENLDLKAESASLSAAQAGASGLALPAPMVGISRLKDQSGKAGGLEITQTIPFPSKLFADHSARGYEADARGAMLGARENEIRAEAKLLYFRLWKAQERVALLQEKKSVIQQHYKLAQAATRSDSFLKIHLVKTESELDLLENEIIQEQQAVRERQIRLAELMNRSPQTYRILAQEFAPSRLPKREDLQHPQQIAVRNAELDFFKARESEARSAWLPDFTLRYREMNGTMMNPKYSEIMVAASVPFVFFWEPKAAAGKAAAERERGEYLLEQEKLRASAAQETLYARAEALKKQLDNFRDKLLPRAEKRMRLVHNVAPREMDTIQDHRETMEAFPELKLKALDAREQYEEAVAELEKLGDL